MSLSTRSHRAIIFTIALAAVTAADGINGSFFSSFVEFFGYPPTQTNSAQMEPAPAMFTAVTCDASPAGNIEVGANAVEPLHLRRGA